MKEKTFEFIKKHKYRLLLLLVMILYSILSFFNLGNIRNPQTLVNLKNKEFLIYKIDSSKTAKKIMFYTGAKEMYVQVYLANDKDQQDQWIHDTDISADYANILKWNEYDLQGIGTHDYLILYSYWDSTLIGEFQVYDEEGNKIDIEATDERSSLLIDEQDTVPDHYSYMNSSYFDEVYFPRTVYEIINNKSIYEYTHPPLGKLIMSIPVAIWGLSPFTYRLIGNICGILMILVIYEIAVALFKKEKYGLFAAIIMALDGMHFTQTRIGTVDSYLVLFCLTSFLFFYKYLSLDKEKNYKQKIISLLISGTFWGMAISVKWTAFFFGAGLGFMWVYEFIFKKNLHINGKFNPSIVLWSILGFVIIPSAIYVASYIPIINNPNSTLTYYPSVKEKQEGKNYFDFKIHDVPTFFIYQKAMYNYHSELSLRKSENQENAHPYSSKWYTWPIMKRPLWFYVSRFYNEDPSLSKYGTIACMGNPAIWWLGIGTTIITLVYSLFKRDREGLMIIVMICATWLTYAFVDREMFIYHYFITLPFVMLSIVFAISKLVEWKNAVKIIMPVLCVVFLGFFIYFYPVYSGIPVSHSYITKTQWLKDWYY